MSVIGVNKFSEGGSSSSSTNISYLLKNTTIVSQVLNSTFSNHTILEEDSQPYNQSFSDNTNNSTMFLNHSSVFQNREEFEHFLGDPDVVHGVAVGFGVLTLCFATRFPKLLGGIAVVTFGVWVGLVFQDLGDNPDPEATVQFDEGLWWLPLFMAIVSSILAGIFAYKTERVGLGILASAILVMISLTFMRLTGMHVEASLNDMHTKPFHEFGVYVYGTIMVVSMVFVFVTKYYYEGVLKFVSAFLGTLLVISGCSYFIQDWSQSDLEELEDSRDGFSLLDDIARMVAQVRYEQCVEYSELYPERHSKEGCECELDCMSEIVAWYILSFAVLIFRWWYERAQQMKENQDQIFLPLREEHGRVVKARRVGRSRKGAARINDIEIDIDE